MEINATFLGQAVAFIIFVVCCMKWVWPPLMNVLEKRQKEIADGLANAEKAKKNLELAKTNAAEVLSKAKAQAQSIIEDANKQRLVILDKATEEANAQKKRIIDSAYTQIESEKNRVREELSSQTVELAIECAQKILEKKVDSQTDRDMVKKIIESL